MGHLLRRRRQQVDRGQFARPGRALDMMGALGRRRSPRRQCLGCSGVRGEPPPAPRALIDRPTHQRVTEAKAPRLVRGPHQIRREQLVERSERHRLVRVRRNGGESRLEGVPDHRRSLQHPPPTGRQGGDLGRQRRLHCPGHAG
jgi:hypothetical protein